MYKKSSIWALTVGVAVVLGSLTSCLGPRRERIQCDAPLPPAQATFSQVKVLFQSDASGKACAAGNCHGPNVAEKGYRFDQDARLYEALTHNMDSVYAQVASGEMPPDEESAVLGLATWSESNLLLLSSWYCNGAFPRD